MACARNIGLSSIPIVCVNIDGFYDAFRVILERAWDDKLTKLRPEQIMHFANSAAEAIEWVESIQGRSVQDQVASTIPPSMAGRRSSRGEEKEMLRLSSVMGTPTTGSTSASNRTGTTNGNSRLNMTAVLGVSSIFVAGFVAGIAFARKRP